MIKPAGYIITDGSSDDYEICNVKVVGDTLYIDDNNICEILYIDQLIEVLQKLKQDYSKN